MKNSTLNTAFKMLKLSRYPEISHTELRAWDAADELLIEWAHLHLPKITNLTIFNDSFGAIAAALSDYLPRTINDSYLSKVGLLKNLAANDIDSSKVTFIESIDHNLKFESSVVFIKIPKTLALFEYQLQQIKKYGHKGLTLVASGMLKHLPKRAFELINHYIGETSTSLAKKKSRLIFATLNQPDSELQFGYPTDYRVPGSTLELSNHANLFSRESIDIGARFMLEHLPYAAPGEDVIDLACGNGILGIALARKNEGVNMSFFDESFMAVSSARLNAEKYLPKSTSVSFHTDDCLSSAPNQSADLVINNPPFHQGQVVGDFFAWTMFKDAHRVLRPKGRLIIVGNRHLGYHVKLKKIFGNARQISANRKFVILESKKI